MTKTHPTALPPAFPSAPSRPGKFEIRFERGSKMIELHSFCEAYASKKFFDAIVGENKYKWIDKTAVELDDLNLTIRCTDLEEIVEHEYSKLEKAWDLPAPYDGYAARLAGIKPMKRAAPTDPVAEDLKDRLKSRQKFSKDNGGTPAKEPRSALTKKKAPPVKELPKGMIGLADICKELKVEPRDARAFLRKEHTKPAHGWAWDKKAAEKIKTDLKKGLK